MKGSYSLWFIRVRVITVITRATIEEQYATRLAALSKAALGGDEIGYVMQLSIRELTANSTHQ